MKTFAVLASLVAACYAQSAFIGAPVANSTVTAGQNITVEIDKPVSMPSLLSILRLIEPIRTS